MYSISIEVAGAQSPELIEEYLLGDATDFRAELTGLGVRTTRQSTIVDALTVVGHIASVAGAIKTVLEIYKLSREGPKEKQVVIVVRNNDTGVATPIPEENVEQALKKILR